RPIRYHQAPFSDASHTHEHTSIEYRRRKEHLCCSYRPACLSLVLYGAVKNANLKPDENVVVVGTGGLGLMAIQLDEAVTGANIIAMDIVDQKLDVAKKNGADIIINSKKEDPVKVIMELTDKLGADTVIDFVNASKTVQMDMQFLRRR